MNIKEQAEKARRSISNVELLEATESIEFLHGQHTKVFNDVDEFYDITLRLLRALEKPAVDVKVCLIHWIKLTEPLMTCLTKEKGYFNAHVNNMIEIVNNLIKVKGVDNDN